MKIARGLVEAEDKPQLGRQKEARNFRVTWSGGVPWRLTRAGCMAVREEVRGVNEHFSGHGHARLEFVFVNSIGRRSVDLSA